tara:strand:+ start:443 stop:673 length:231 start_codon:yes stop_codon:yes gene_type:complete
MDTIKPIKRNNNLLKNSFASKTFQTENTTSMNVKMKIPQIVFLNPYFFMKNLAILLDSEEDDLTNFTVVTQSNSLV